MKEFKTKNASASRPKVERKQESVVANTDRCLVEIGLKGLDKCRIRFIRKKNYRTSLADKETSRTDKRGNSKELRHSSFHVSNK